MWVLEIGYTFAMLDYLECGHVIPVWPVIIQDYSHDSNFPGETVELGSLLGCKELKNDVKF